MADADEDPFWYPTVDDILTIHDDIIEEDEDSEPGVRDSDQIQYAIDHVKHGHFGEGPETIHEKAFHLMRLLAANHWFVDGNKRTALNTMDLFYTFNGYELDYGEDLRSMLKLLSVREELIDKEVAVEYLAEQTAEETAIQDMTEEQLVLGVLLTPLDDVLDDVDEFELGDDENDRWKP